MTKFMKFSIVIASIFVVMLFGNLATTVNATNFTLDGIMSSADSWVAQGKDEGETYSSNIAQPVSTIATALYSIGVVVLLVVTLILAVKYITCNPDEQARIKTQLIGLIISSVVLFGAVPLWRMIAEALSSTFGG